MTANTNETAGHLTDDVVGMSHHDTLARKILVIWLPLAVFLFVLLFPFYWMAITAVKPNDQLTNYSVYSPFWVVGPTLDHIKYLLFETSYPGWLWNTMVVAFFSTIISLAASANSSPPSASPSDTAASRAATASPPGVWVAL